MKKKLVLLFILLSIFALYIGYRELNTRKAQVVIFDQLFSGPDQYNNKNVVVEGFFFQGWELIVLCEKLENSGLAEGHLVPKGRMIWVEGGIQRGVFETLYKQDMMGPEERFGKIRVKGKFEFGGKFGHLGEYKSQIIPSEVELLQWSP